jgi:hypothetical protein
VFSQPSFSIVSQGPPRLPILISPSDVLVRPPVPHRSVYSGGTSGLYLRHHPLICLLASIAHPCRDLFCYRDCFDHTHLPPNPEFSILDQFRQDQPGTHYWYTETSRRGRQYPARGYRDVVRALKESCEVARGTCRGSNGSGRSSRIVAA